MKTRNHAVTAFIIIGSIVVIIAALAPFLKLGFLNCDDLEYYLTGLRKFNYWFTNANIYARGAGRFYFIITKPFYLIPYLFDNFYYTKIVQYLFLLLSYGIFSYFIYKAFRSSSLGLIVFILLVGWTQISANNYVPTIAYPFYFSFSFSLCLCSILLFIKYAESNRYGYAIGGAILFLFTLLFYETYLLFLIIFCFYILIRNWKKFGFKKLWSKKIFYKEALPYIVVGLLYVITYFTYRALIVNPEGFYSGCSFASHFSFRNFFKIICRYTKSALPMVVYFQQKADMLVNTQLVDGHYNNMLYVLTHAKPITYICSVVVGFLFFLLTYKPKRLSYKHIWVGIVVSVFMAFLSHALVGIAEKYNSDLYPWMLGCVTTYYSCFGITLAIVLFLIFILKLCVRYKSLYYTVISVFTIAIFASCTVIGYSNDNLSREWERSQNRFHVLNDMIKQGYFDSMNEGIIFNKDLIHTTQWGHTLIKDDYILENYLNVKTNKKFHCTSEEHVLFDFMTQNPKTHVYYIQIGETVKNCEMMLAISDLGKAEKLNTLDLKCPVAHSSDIFYYSPTKDYMLMFNSLDSGSMVLDNRDTFNVCKGLNSLTVINLNKNKTLTRLSISSSSIKANSFFISNMRHETMDTVLVAARQHSSEGGNGHSALVEEYIKCIKSSPKWMQSIKKKAAIRNIPVDSILLLDATYMAEQN